MDIITNYLSIELSRKCNLNCRHCLRGDSQNISINESIVNKLFDEVKVASNLVLSGGEPFLCYEEMKMVCNIIKNRNIKIDNVIIVTNGTIYDKRIYELLEANFNIVKIHISMDKYHDESIKRFSLKEQDKMFDNYIKIKDSKYFASLYFSQKYLIDMGNATNLDELKKDYDVLGYFYTILNNRLYVGPELYIDSLGYICDGNSSYELRDKYSIGNINNSLLSNMILNNAIEFNISNEEDVYAFFQKRINEYQRYLDNSYDYKDNKIVRKLTK